VKELILVIALEFTPTNQHAESETYSKATLFQII